MEAWTKANFCSDFGACNTVSWPHKINRKTKHALRYFTPRSVPNVMTTDSGSTVASLRKQLHFAGQHTGLRACCAITIIDRAIEMLGAMMA